MLGEPGGILASRRRANPQGRIPLGEPTKQNEGERRAWLGPLSVKRSCARENTGQIRGTAPTAITKLEWIDVEDEERLPENQNRYDDADGVEAWVGKPQIRGVK